MPRHHSMRAATFNALKARLSLDFPHVGKLAAIVDHMKSKVEALGNLHESPSPTQTEAANFKRIALAAQKLGADAKAAQDQINAILREGATDLQRRMDTKVNLKPSEHAQEIRQVYRGLKSGDQAKMLQDLAVANSGPELGSIITVPAILTGITPEMQNRYRDEIMSIHARDEFDEMRALTNSLDPAWTATTVAVEVAAEYSDPYQMAAIERGEAAAAAAEAAFNNVA